MYLPPKPGVPAQLTVPPIPSSMPVLPVPSLVPGLLRIPLCVPVPMAMPMPFMPASHPNFEAPGKFLFPPLMPDSGFVYVYHYTNEKAKDAIIASGYIAPSLKRNGDAVYGEGVYVTDLSPLAGSDWLARNNWGVPSPDKKWAFRIKMQKEKILDVTDARNIFRRISLYPGTLYLQEFEWKFGRVPDNSCTII